MVPKGSFPLDLKISSKGLSWVDLMCQKFEAICEGVDKSPPAIIQETTRLIDQISTVGANMQKLCSDFMDDIIPPITEVDDKFLCYKFSTKSEEDLNLTEKSDQEEDTMEFSFCEEVDKNSSALVQETTMSIGDRMITAGENVQKFSSDLMEDMLALVKNIDDKCLSSKLSANAEEDLKSSDPEKGMDETLNCKSVDSPDVDQDAAIEIQVLDVIDQLDASCLHEENVSVKSTGEDLSQAKTIECYSGEDASERVFEDKGSLQERSCLREDGELHLSQIDIPLQLDGELLSNRTDASESVFEDKGSLQERSCLREDAELLLSQIDIPLQLDGELLSNRTGVVDVTEQEKNGIMGLAGRIKLDDHPSPGEKLLLENGTLEVILKEYENVEQNLPDEDVERVLSVAEPYTAIPPTCSKKGNFKKSLYLAVKEKEQVARWYGNPHVQACKGIDMSSSNSFVDITDSCRWPDAENSDSEWELL